MAEGIGSLRAQAEHARRIWAGALAKVACQVTNVTAATGSPASTRPTQPLVESPAYLRTFAGVPSALLHPAAFLRPLPAPGRTSQAPRPAGLQRRRDARPRPAAACLSALGLMRRALCLCVSELETCCNDRRPHTRIPPHPCGPCLALSAPSVI